MREDGIESASSAQWAMPSVQKVLSGAYTDSQKLFEDDTEAMYQIEKKPAELPGLNNVTLAIDCHDHKNPDGTRKITQLHFQYLAASLADEPRLADLTFRADNMRSFRLTHRLVRPDFQNRGIGTMILKKSEEWFSALAKAQKEDVALTIPVAQMGLINWAAKNGFAVLEDKILFETVVTHPELFDIHDIERSDGIRDEQYIFAKNTTDQTAKTAIRFQLQKTIRGQ